MSSKKFSVIKLVFAAVFLAIALVLPFVTAGIPQIGNMLCPMHIPVLLCGFFCGPWFGLGVGFVAPLLRFALFGMPPLIPIGIAMAFELATYGFITGFLYKKLPKTKVNVYVSLLVAMVAGRIIWGIVKVILMGVTGTEFGWQAFISGAFLTAIPGIIVQIVLIPILVIALRKAVPKLNEQ